MTEFKRQDPDFGKDKSLNDRIARCVTENPDEWFLVVDGAANRSLADRITKGRSKPFIAPQMIGKSQAREDGRFNIYAKYDSTITE